MNDQWNLPRIAKAFADAALDPAHWVAALDLIAAETRSAGAILLPKTDRLPGVPFSQNIGEASVAYLTQGWATRDPRDAGMARLLRAGVGNDFTSVSPERIARDPYYQEFLRDHGLGWYGCIGFSVGDDYWFVSIQRTIEQGPFDAHDLKRLHSLRGGLASAATLARAVEFGHANGLQDGFEMLGQAAFLVNQEGSVTRVNEPARRLAGPALQVIGGKLTTPSPDMNAQIERHIGNACSQGRSVQSALVIEIAGRLYCQLHAIPRQEGPVQRYCGDCPSYAAERCFVGHGRWPAGSAVRFDAHRNKGSHAAGWWPIAG